MAISNTRFRSIGFVSLALGVWLVISAFVWPHSASQSYNAWIVGILAALLAAAALRFPEARWGNTALGLWLFLSVWIIPTLYVATWWNHVLVGAALFVCSLIPGYVGTTTPEGRVGRADRHVGRM